MKAISFAAGLFAAVLTTHADKIRLQDLTPEVQGKIRAHTGAAEINDIDRTAKNGQPVYEVGFKKDDRQVELTFDQQGNLLNPDASAIADSRKVSWDELPDAVKRTAAGRITKANVNDIDRHVKDGQVTYEIGFKDSKNAQQEIVFSQDGRILRDIETPAALIAAAGSATAPALTDVQSVPLNYAPQEVQTAVVKAAGTTAVTRFQKAKTGGETVYVAGFRSNRKPAQIYLNQQGGIIYDSRTSAAGAPAAAASASGSSLYPNVTSAVPLSASEKVDRRSVPAAVEKAIGTSTAGARVEDIERGAWQGRNIYQVAFKDNGKHVELQIDENGNIVFDPRKQQ